MRIAAVSVLGVMAWAPFAIDGLKAFFIFYYWTYYLAIMVFALLIYPSFVVWPEFVGMTYDTLVCTLFQIGFSLQLTAFGFYYTGVYSYET